MNIAARQPILVRELRQVSRQGRMPWIFGALTVLLALAMASVAAMMASGGASLNTIGAMLYQTFFALGTCVVVVVGATVAANGVASEHEGRTWEALLLSGLSPGAIVTGKFLAAYTQVATYLVAIAPVAALSFLVGGVTVTELVVGLGLLLAVAALAVLFGLATSSLVRSARGALVVTVLTTILVGPFVYGLFMGVGAVGLEIVGAGDDVGPSWLALGIARAPFSLRYVVVLLVDPLLAIVLPAWFFFELTKANVTGHGNDRSSGLRRWFVVATPLLVLGILATVAVETSTRMRGATAAFGLLVVALHLGFTVLVFAGEPLVPARRVLLGGSIGAGIGRTTTVQAVVGTLAIAALTAAGAYVSNPNAREMLGLAGLDAAGFHLFVLGLAGVIAIRSGRPLLARLVTACVTAALVVLPLGVAEIVRAGVGSEGARALGAPSPVYAAMIGRFPTELEQNAGLAFAVGYALAGLVLVVVIRRRSAAARKGGTRHDSR